MNKKELLAHIKSINGKGKNEIFSLPLGELKILPGFNRRIDYDLEPLIEYIKVNGVKFPPLKLQIVDGELWVDQGHRRTLASIEAGCDLETTRLDCYVDSTENTERNFADRLADQISSNQGKAYTNMELMLICRELKEKYNWEPKEIYTRLNISQSKYSNLSQLFKFSNKLIIAIDDSKVKYSEILEAVRMGYTEAEIFEEIRAKIKYREELESYEAAKSSPVISAELSTLAITESVVEGEHISDVPFYDDINSDSGRFVPMVAEVPKLPAPPTPPKPPKAAWKKPDYSKILHSIVNLYEIEESGDYMAIKIPVEDWNTIMQELETGKKK